MGSCYYWTDRISSAVRLGMIEVPQIHSVELQNYISFSLRKNPCLIRFQTPITTYHTYQLKTKECRKSLRHTYIIGINTCVEIVIEELLKTGFWFEKYHTRFHNYVKLQLMLRIHQRYKLDRGSLYFSTLASSVV